MAFTVASLWRAPEVNPVNRKARSIPALNPFNMYGRVFNVSWFGFLIAFWSWYAFPPLVCLVSVARAAVSLISLQLTITVRKDLGLSQDDISNSNIISLTATLIVRLLAGPACDRFGPRLTFAACLLAGAIPTALAGTVTTVSGLLVLRFFIGILGGTFIPCQVWSTAFFDKNVVGTSNALTAGWGNAGGGITYFVMPAIFDSLVARQHLTAHVAWRVAFIVPFILITTTAIVMLLFCPDAPTGRWSDRDIAITRNLSSTEGGLRRDTDVVHISKVVGRPKEADLTAFPLAQVEGGREASPRRLEEAKASLEEARAQAQLQLEERERRNAAVGEVVQAPSLKKTGQVIFSMQTLALNATYFCSFGAELSLNSVLGAYYLKNFPSLGQTGSGEWAAMFGLLNIVFRPAGGMVSDAIFLHRARRLFWDRPNLVRSPTGGRVSDSIFLHRARNSLWGKKMWIHFLAFVTGAFMMAIGFTDSHSRATLFGLFAGTAFFLEAGNGATFSLVPHVHPSANGLLTGLTGASGNLGGIIFAVIFRCYGVEYCKTLWIMGIMTIAINAAVMCIPPIPRGQLGER